MAHAAPDRSHSSHAAVAQDLAQVVAGDGEGVSLGVAEAGATHLGVSDALGVAVLDLEAPERGHRLRNMQPPRQNPATRPRSCQPAEPVPRGKRPAGTAGAWPVVHGSSSPLPTARSARAAARLHPC